MSQSSLQRLFKRYLESAPVVPIRSKSKVHLLLDGTYFPNNLCLILYYDHDIRYVQLYRETDQESFVEIAEDLNNLIKLGVEIYSITCDGHKASLKAIKKSFPHVIIQRCLVHIKRQIRNYLSLNPKTIQARELLKISNRVTSIKTMEESGLWLLELHAWHHRHKTYLYERSYNQETKRYWYTHKNLHGAFTLLKRAIPNMFAYLDDPEIPYTTNRLENYFAHLKEKLTLHKGLRLRKTLLNGTFTLKIILIYRFF